MIHNHVVLAAANRSMLQPPVDEIEANAATDAIIFNVLLFVALLGVGLSLDLQAVAGILSQPLTATRSLSRAIILSTSALYLVMPCIASTIASRMQLPSKVAVSLVLAAAMPGGPLSAVYAMAAGANTAVNVVMTTLTSGVAVVMVPLVCEFVVEPWTEGHKVHISQVHVILTSACIVVPLCLGTIIGRSTSEAFKRRVESIMGPIVVTVMVGLLATRAKVALTPERMTGAVLLALCGHSVGLGIGMASGIGGRNTISLMYELAIRDLPLAMSVVMNSFKNNVAFREEVVDGVLVYGLMSNLLTLVITIVLKLLTNTGVVEFAALPEEAGENESLVKSEKLTCREDENENCAEPVKEAANTQAGYGGAEVTNPPPSCCTCS
eukprot:TRINITY_DN44754_c0_g1_i1.p1 TRINITY_DN44754_c0_g1~~TRINITY_DN44754_c0_g1_i1.p1  ORF type:complete len:396 (+),score=56.97 TRINITY_DN44754_c0_g1_i1:46-1188(+)